MKILKLLLTTVLTFNCVDICKASCESIATYIVSQSNFFKLGLSDLKTDIKEKLNTRLTAEEEEDFNTHMWQGEIVRKGAEGSLSDLVREYNEIKYKKEKDDEDNLRLCLLSGYIPCRMSFTTETFLKKFLDKIRNNEIFIPDNLLDNTSEPLKKFKDSLKELELDNGIVLFEKNLKDKFTNEGIAKIFFLKDYLVENISELIPEFILEFYSFKPNKTPLETFKARINFELYSFIALRSIF